MAWSASREPDFTETDRSAFAALAARVVARLPDPGEHSDLDTSLDASAGDPWMRYWAPSDVSEWLSAFIIPRLPRMLDALVLGEATPMLAPRHTLASLAVAVEDRRVALRLSEPDARRLCELLRTPWKEVTVVGPTHTLSLLQTDAVRGPIGVVDERTRELTWRLGKSTRAVLIELLEAPVPGRLQPVEDRAGSLRFETGVTLDVRG